ncbi:DNA-3-methyladenine glycosylase I [Jannaschia seohaensis]|uniref:DNA-3-methyladenine glycosylase I n=1 Tax=Jannaschia seohaensis TaxID=475081 RepID=A0A2Y9AXB8_9RHOB|nr:DNA-3-methyladenine glycosylase I [Jannaschia seohaensis]PWJ18164.1 DNA-3-methyladenine glycosylase I [Jannaschia seohaensis]SSA46689.1 DNA-3-methyladenine glycosylase I [Jannaschia seohaensis]
MQRCGWVSEDPLYIGYHDTEWGVPQRDGRAMWEALQLEGFQAGLSWITILRKREGFRAAFADFAPEVIAAWGEAEVARLVADPGIVRHRGKIEAVIGNARAYLEMEDFGAWAWAFVDGVPLQPVRADLSEVPGQTDLSRRISKELKRRGFRFCGPTTVYAWMQATGMVNDHVVTCPRHAPLA